MTKLITFSHIYIFLLISIKTFKSKNIKITLIITFSKTILIINYNSSSLFNKNNFFLWRFSFLLWGIKREIKRYHDYLRIAFLPFIILVTLEAISILRLCLATTLLFSSTSLVFFCSAKSE